MAARKPRTRNSGTMTEAGFMGWVRSLLRRGTLKWKPRNDALILARRPYDGPDKRRKWEYECAICGLYFPRKQVEVDHKDEAGTLTSLDDLPGFVERLFCEVEWLRVLCKECHSAKH